MKNISLCGEWRMTGNGYDCVGTVPGSMYSFLLNNNLIPDPYYRDNEYPALELSYHDYTFERKFDYKKTGDKVSLHFDGLDTFCDVYLNGKHIAYTDDMHVEYEFDVTDVLVDGENTIKVECHTTLYYAQEKAKELDLFANPQALIGFGYVR